MKVSYEERLAIDFGLRRRCGEGNDPVLSVRSGGTRRPAIELRNPHFRVPILSRQGEGNIDRAAIGKARPDAAESQNLCMRGHSKRENREIPSVPSIEGSFAHCLDGQRTSPRARLA